MGAEVIIIMGKLDCIDGFIKACIGCAKNQGVHSPEWLIECQLIVR